MVERFYRRLKDPLRTRCAAANWVDNLPWVLLGLCAAAREYDGSTPAQAVFGSPLIAPGQFLDSPELPSSAAEHTATRHNTTAARLPPPQLLDDLARAPMVFMRRDGHVLPLQLLYDGPYTVIRHSLHHFTLPISDKEDKVSTVYPPTQALHRPYSAACAAQGPGPPARRHPLPRFSPAGGRGGPQGTLRPTASSIHFPLARRQGFLHAPPPFSTLLPLGPQATAERRPD
jgi:hypothetical protein